MDFLKINKEAWNKRTTTDVKSKFYDVEGFLAGDSSLNPIELKLLLDVQCQSLLHL